MARRRDSGFIMITTLIIGSLLVICAALALKSAENILEEAQTAAAHLQMKNAASQASALAEAWFRANIGDIVDKDDFVTSADYAEAPEHSIPSGFFKLLEEEYPSLSISCRTIDLHYGDEYEETAEDLRIPRIPPLERSDGAIERAYIQKISVSNDNGGADYTRATSLRAVKNTSGDISVIVVGRSE